MLTVYRTALPLLKHRRLRTVLAQSNHWRRYSTAKLCRPLEVQSELQDSKNKLHDARKCFGTNLPQKGRKSVEYQIAGHAVEPSSKLLNLRRLDYLYLCKVSD